MVWRADYIYISHLGPDLVAALARLQVDDLSHGGGGLGWSCN